MIEFNELDSTAEVTCDICGDVSKYKGCRDFAHAVHKAKDDKFQIKKEGDEWKHYCFLCTLG